MPDGDIFQRKLRGTGRGWVTTSRLLRYGAAREVLEKSISKACADDLRRIPSDLVIAGRDILLAAMREENLSRKGLKTSNSDPYLFLLQESRLLGKGGDFEVSTILKESLKSVFVANRNECETLSADQTSDRLGETLISNLIDRRLFSRIRDPLMLEQNRDSAKEMEWENNLRREMKYIGKKMMNDFLHGTAKKFRAPVLRRRQRKSAEDFLNQSLPVLPQL
jgi:hypothetical protein